MKSNSRYTNATHEMDNTETATFGDDWGDEALEVTPCFWLAHRIGRKFGVCTSFVALSLHLLHKVATILWQVFDTITKLATLLFGSFCTCSSHNFPLQGILTSCKRKHMHKQTVTQFISPCNAINVCVILQNVDAKMGDNVVVYLLWKRKNLHTSCDQFFCLSDFYNNGSCWPLLCC